MSHCQSVLSWQAILLDAVPSAFRLRSLRRGRGGLSFAWQLFSCRFISVGITSFLNIPSPYTQKNQGNYKPFQKVFWKSASFTKGLFGFVDYALLILPSIYKEMGKVKSKPEIQFFWNSLHYVWSGKSCFLRLHSEFRRPAQNRDLGFVQYSVLSFIPFTCYHWEKAKSNPNQETFLSLLFYINQVICFCTIFSF